MRKKLIMALSLALLVFAFTSCSSLFGGGDYKADVVNTLSVEHDDFTLETEYSMTESGLYYSMLPIKLSYTTGDEDIGDSPDWHFDATVYDSMGFGTVYFLNSVAIMNSRGDRFTAENLNGLMAQPSDTETSGGMILDDDEIPALYQVFSDAENLDYIRIRYNDEYVYDMTLPQAYAVTYFIDYIRNTVQPTEV